MSQVIIINGSGRTGKDTFCGLCGKYANVSICSAVSCVKQAAAILGWNGEKDERSRKFLSDLKDLATEFSDAPMDSLRRFVRMHQNSDEMIFLMVREPPEIARAQKEFDAITLLLKRPQAEQITTNHADRDVDLYDYDYIIHNNGTLADLDEMARSFVEKVHTGWFAKRKEQYRD